MGNIGPERRHIEVLPIEAPSAPPSPDQDAPVEPFRQPVPAE